MEKARYGIEIARLNKSYILSQNVSYHSQRVLEISDLFIPFGKIVSILGRSGSGKSTLLNILGLNLSPDMPFGQDDIIYKFPPGINYRITNDISLKHICEDESLRLRIQRELYGFLFQDAYLFPGMSLENNLKMPLLLNDYLIQDDYFSKLVINSGLFEELQNITPNFGKRVPSEYSGGQLQRLALFRSFLHKPYILFADEPTGNLDPTSAKKVFKFLREWRKKHEYRTIIVVTHDLNLARKFADVIMILDSRHQIQPDAVFKANSDNENRWSANIEEMTNLMSREGKKAEKQQDSNIKFNNYKIKKGKNKLRFPFVFSLLDLFPKTPNLLWTTLTGIIISTFLSLMAILILGFYKGSANYLNYLQANPFIHSIIAGRDLTENLISQKEIEEMRLINVADRDSFYIMNDNNDSSKVITYASGFIPHVIFASFEKDVTQRPNFKQLKGRTIDWRDPVNRIVKNSLIAGHTFKSFQDIGVILSQNALQKLGYNQNTETIKKNPPDYLNILYEAGTEKISRSLKILGIAEKLPTPFDDFLITNFFMAQLNNHYLSPNNIRNFEMGYLKSLSQARNAKQFLLPKILKLSIKRIDFFKDNKKFVLKFSYLHSIHEDSVARHAQIIHNFLKEHSINLHQIPLERKLVAITKDDTSYFNYAAIYLKNLKYAKGLFKYLRTKFSVDIGKNLIESLETIHQMRRIVFLIMIILFCSIALTGAFTIYSIFNQFTQRSIKQLGVLKAMGANKWRFRLIHFLELLWLFSISNIISVVLAVIIGNQLNHLLHRFISKKIYSAAFFELSTSQVLMLLLGIFLVYSVAVFIATKSIYKKSAIELISDQREPKQIFKKLADLR